MQWDRVVDSRDLTMFYVYLHIDAKTEMPFYVGKGIGPRCWDNKGRSTKWHKRTSDCIWYPVLLFKGLSSDEALTKEHETILRFRREGIAIVNTSNGSYGPTALPIQHDAHVRALDRHLESEARYRRILAGQAAIKF